MNNTPDDETVRKKVTALKARIPEQLTSARTVLRHLLRLSVRYVTTQKQNEATTFFASVYHGPALIRCIDTLDDAKLFQLGSYYYQKKFVVKQITLWPIPKIANLLQKSDTLNASQ